MMSEGTTNKAKPITIVATANGRESVRLRERKSRAQRPRAPTSESVSSHGMPLDKAKSAPMGLVSRPGAYSIPLPASSAVGENIRKRRTLTRNGDAEYQRSPMDPAEPR